MCALPEPPGEGVASEFRLHRPEIGSGTSLANEMDALDVPELGISRKLGLASELGVLLVLLLFGSVSFQRVWLGEGCPGVNPSTSNRVVF